MHIGGEWGMVGDQHLDRAMSKRVHYVDENTRVRWRFYFAALGRVHAKERRVPFLFLWHRWKVVAWIYDDVISGERSFPYLLHWLDWSEREEGGFRGYRA